MWRASYNCHRPRAKLGDPRRPARVTGRHGQVVYAWTMLFLLLLTATTASLPSQEEATTIEQRQQLVQEIAADVRQTGLRLGTEASVTRVLEVMRQVPRHTFVPPPMQHLAYANRPLPIGHGQTISQPYIVAVMTALLAVDTADKVLEIGTGSGYQTAVLAALAQHVYSIEIIAALASTAQERLARLGYTNVDIRVSDGYYGWEEHAPYDAIMVTAAASHIPPPLLKQLKPGGRMVIPVGSPFLTQQLTWVEKTPEGSLRTRQMLPVAFVPLTGKH